MGHVHLPIVEAALLVAQKFLPSGVGGEFVDQPFDLLLRHRGKPARGAGVVVDAEHRRRSGIEMDVARAEFIHR